MYSEFNNYVGSLEDKSFGPAQDLCGIALLDAKVPGTVFSCSSYLRKSGGTGKILNQKDLVKRIEKADESKVSVITDLLSYCREKEAKEILQKLKVSEVPLVKKWAKFALREGNNGKIPVFERRP